MQRVATDRNRSLGRIQKLWTLIYLSRIFKCAVYNREPIIKWVVYFNSMFNQEADNS